MAQAISIAEFVTGLASGVLPEQQAERFFVATSEGNIHAFTAHAGEYRQEIFAHLDDVLFSGVAAYTTVGDVQHVVAATMDGNLYHFAADSQTPRLMASFDGTMFSAISAYSSPLSGGQYVVVATGEGAVYHLALQEREVVRQQLGEFASGIIAVSGLVTLGDDAQHVFVAASDGYIHHFTLRPGQSAEQQVMAFFEESFISLASYLRADGLIHLIPATRDGKLYHVVYDASKGQQVHIDIRDGIKFHDASKTPGVSVDILKRFYQVNESGMMFITGYTTDDGGQHVLVVSSDGAITHFSFHKADYSDLTYSVVAQFQSMI